MNRASSVHRRRRKGLTDYRLRRRFLLSKKPRLVCRGSDRYVSAAIVEAREGGDLTIASANSKEFRKLGWRFGLNNVPVAYLLGSLLARRVAKLDLTEVILDIGLSTPTRGNKLFAVAKGCLDSGLKILFDESVAPSEDRLRGEHLVKFAEAGPGGLTFSSIKEQGADIRSLPNEFDSLLARIRKGEFDEHG